MSMRSHASLETFIYIYSHLFDILVNESKLAVKRSKLIFSQGLTYFKKGWTFCQTEATITSEKMYT